MTKTGNTKVRVSFTIELDAAAYCEEYGIERSELRDDLRTNVRDAVQAYLAELLLDGDVRVSA